MADLAQDLLKLKKRVEAAHQLRSNAEVAVGVVTQQLAQVDAEIAALGIEDPDKLDVEVDQLTAQIDLLITQANAALDTETKAYQAILEAARAAGVIR